MPENANQKAQDAGSYYAVNVSEKPSFPCIIWGGTSELRASENLCLRKFSNLSSAKVYI